MGGCCCACYGVTQVLEDPSVTIKTRVGDIGIGSARVAVLSVRGACGGVMYVDGDTLRYMGCCVYSTKLKDITIIEVVDIGYVLIGGKHVVLRPGLKISLNNGSTIAVAVPEPRSFADVLRKAVPAPK